MGSLGGNGSIWGMRPSHGDVYRRRDEKRSRSSSSSRGSKPSGSGDATGGASSSSYRFPVKPAATAASLAVTGDSIAQLRNRWISRKDALDHSHDMKDIVSTLMSEHDWIRSIRMISYGFLLYGPGSFAWYQLLDRSLPEKSVQNLVAKVVLNQVILGPSVIAVVFAWNSLWQGKFAELPNKYKNHALPTLLTGFRFWIPVTILNFWLVPLQARVAIMSMGSMFWNFYLSSTVNR